MAIEGVKSIAMTYQGSVSSTVAKPETISVEKASANIAETTVDMTVKSDSQKNSGAGTESKQRQNSEAEAMKRAVEELNKNCSNSVVQFGIHDATNRMTIKILDKETKEVIKEFPPEKTLDIIAKVWEVAGIIVDEKR